MKQQPDRGFADAISQVARALQAEPSAQDTLQKMVALAVETIGGYDHAGVTIIDGQVSTPAATGDVPRQVDQIQYDTDQGPCLEAIRSHRTYVTDDLGAEDRSPLFTVIGLQDLRVQPLEDELAHRRRLPRPNRGDPHQGVGLQHRRSSKDSRLR